MNVGNIGATTYNPWTRRTAEPKTTNAGNSNFAQAIGNQGVATNLVLHGVSEDSMKGSFGANVQRTGNVVHIDSDALFSIQDAKTGESANVYRADEYSEDNPIYLVKGIDKNGKEYEQTVDVSKVNPNSCSYTELLALNAHNGKRSDSNFMTMAILKDKMEGSSYHEKTDYMAMAYELMDDMKTLGNWEGYLRYGNWIHDILTFCKDKS